MDALRIALTNLVKRSMVDINFWAIFASGIASLVIGVIWYAPPVFGTIWMRAAGLSESKVSDARKKMPIMALIAVLGALVLAWVTKHFAVVWGVVSFWGALELGFWVWLGFMIPPLMSSVLWEQKSITYFAVNAGYWLVISTVVASIVSLWT